MEAGDVGRAGWCESVALAVSGSAPPHCDCLPRFDPQSIAAFRAATSLVACFGLKLASEGFVLPIMAAGLTNPLVTRGACRSGHPDGDPVIRRIEIRPLRQGFEMIVVGFDPEQESRDK
jgi:hypothetical protein